jgi:hypothetical protein
MPDSSFMFAPKYSDFSLGLFDTNMPERFGVLHGGKVINKDSTMESPAKAWGAIVFSKKVRDYWLTCHIMDYTHALNLAILAFGLETWELAYYHDISCMHDYMDLVRDYA